MSENTNITIPNTELNNDETTEDLITKYYPCNDPNRPICRQYVNQGTCKKRKHCNFYHPKVVSNLITKKAKRELGCCYCGSPQKTIIGHRTINYNRYESAEDVPRPVFFRVCSRTGKSMKKCL